MQLKLLLFVRMQSNFFESNLIALSQANEASAFIFNFINDVAMFMYHKSDLVESISIHF